MNVCESRKHHLCIIFGFLQVHLNAYVFFIFFEQFCIDVNCLDRDTLGEMTPLSRVIDIEIN